MTAKSRDIIFQNLKRAAKPFPDISKPQPYLEMVPVSEKDTGKLWLQFARESEKLSAKVYRCIDADNAREELLRIVGNERHVSCWSEENLPLPALPEFLKPFTRQDGEGLSDLRIGISGALAAIAATGTVIIHSGPGRYRATSLLPEIHIILLQRKQIYTTFENWLATQRKKGMRDVLHPGNVVLISGPSRTADIAMELVLGMHGPREVHIIIF
jgi:L-lactate dehydrogenase complex protein LldG